MIATTFQRFGGWGRWVDSNVKALRGGGHTTFPTQPSTKPGLRAVSSMVDSVQHPIRGVGRFRAGKAPVGSVGHPDPMPDDLVPDDLWERIAPLLPPRPARRSRFPGRTPIDDRVALGGVLFVLRTNVSWRDVPAETIGCSGITCWRRLREWTEAGVWPRLHALLLTELRAAHLLDMDDVAVDGSHVRALKGGLTRVRHRSIGVGRAANIMCSSTGTAHPWR